MSTQHFHKDQSQEGPIKKEKKRKEKKRKGKREREREAVLLVALQPATAEREQWQAKNVKLFNNDYTIIYSLIHSRSTDLDTCRDHGSLIFDVKLVCDRQIFCGSVWGQ